MAYIKMLLSRDQRYNSESKSQQQDSFREHPYCCYQEIKDTILKANHNRAKSVK